MKIVKFLVMGFVVVIAVYVVMCILGPKSFQTEKSIVVNASPQTVFALTSDFNKWSKWSPWQQKDAQMKNMISGNPGEIGHKMIWESESQGSGEQEIVEVKLDEMIKTKLSFKDWDEVSYASFFITPQGESTKVSWTMEGSEIPFMMRGMMVAFNAMGTLEEDYEQGLSSIKKLSEEVR